jgi:hypothetical protein
MSHVVLQDAVPKTIIRGCRACARTLIGRIEGCAVADMIHVVSAPCGASYTFPGITFHRLLCSSGLIGTGVTCVGLLVDELMAVRQYGHPAETTPETSS